MSIRDSEVERQSPPEQENKTKDKYNFSQHGRDKLNSFFFLSDKTKRTLV